MSSAPRIRQLASMSAEPAPSHPGIPLDAQGWEDPVSAPPAQIGEALSSISRRIVILHKEYHGKGPDRARTYVQDDVVMVLMRGGFTRVEETLQRDGRHDAVRRQREEFRRVMHDRFVEVIEEELDREVAAFMGTTHQNPDLLVQIFVLAPSVQRQETAYADRDRNAVGR